jgi:hypothetical protein
MTLRTRISLTIATLTAVLAAFVGLGGSMGSPELLIIVVLFVAALVVIWRPRLRTTDQ